MRAFSTEGKAGSSCFACSYVSPNPTLVSSLGRYLASTHGTAFMAYREYVIMIMPLDMDLVRYEGDGSTVA